MRLSLLLLRAARLAARLRGWPPPVRPAAFTLTPAEAHSETLTLQLAGGTTAASLYRPRDAGGDEVVLVLHPGGVTRAACAPWVTALLAAGLNVVAPDLDGHGSNTRPYTSLATAAEVVAAAVAELERLGLGPFGLLGASLGGGVGLLGAAAQPTVSAVALLAMPHAATFSQLVSLNLLRAVWEGQYLRGAPVRRATPRRRLDLVRDTLASARLLEAATRLAPRPLLLIHGAFDPYAPPQQGRELRAAHGTATLWTYPVSHAGALYSPEAVDRVALWLAARLRD